MRLCLQELQFIPFGIFAFFSIRRNSSKNTILQTTIIYILLTHHLPSKTVIRYSIKKKSLFEAFLSLFVLLVLLFWMSHPCFACMDCRKRGKERRHPRYFLFSPLKKKWLLCKKYQAHITAKAKKKQNKTKKHQLSSRSSPALFLRDVVDWLSRFVRFLSWHGLQDDVWESQILWPTRPVRYCRS